MKYVTLCVGQLEANCYLLYDEGSKEALIIDPGADAKFILKRVAQLQLKATGIVLTHGHCDHIGAVIATKTQMKCQIFAHKKERSVLSAPEHNYSTSYGNGPLTLEADEWISDGYTFKLGRHELKVVHTPGHTPGSICILNESQGLLFSGDTLFSDDVGRTDLFGGDAQQLKKSIHNKLFAYNDDILVLSGHGPESTLGDIKKRLTKTSKSRSF